MIGHFLFFYAGKASFYIASSIFTLHFSITPF